MDNTKKLAWWGYQTRLGKINLTKKYFSDKLHIELSEKEKEYIYDQEH